MKRQRTTYMVLDLPQALPFFHTTVATCRSLASYLIKPYRFGVRDINKSLVETYE